MAPFILLGLAIMSVAVIVNDLWHAFTGGNSVLKDFWFQLKNWGPVEKIIKGIKRAVDGLASAFKRLRNETKQWAQDQRDFWSGRHGGIGDIKDAIMGKKYKDRYLVSRMAQRAQIQAKRGAKKAGITLPPTRPRTSEAGGVGGTTNISATVGDINVTVPPGADAKETGSMVKRAIDNALSEHLRAAKAVLK